jgi:hypothetical protein
MSIFPVVKFDNEHVFGHRILKQDFIAKNEHVFGRQRCVMYIRFDGSKLSHFLTGLEWATERSICGDPRIGTRFGWQDPVVLYYTIVRRAIGEQHGCATQISF